MIRLRSPVKREGAERYLLLTLVSFAASVVLTRIYLELTGYPQIGSGVLHIAHVLWGGLLLFIATLAPIIFANRWAYRLAAVLGGVGVGLFIDEVGKFVTQSNDYFFPLAAPIIYAFFLLTVMIYLEVRRPTKPDSRTELYSALDQIMELIENDLDHVERASLEARLIRVIRDARFPEHARLAEALLAVINSDTLYIATPNPPLLQRLFDLLHDLETRYVTRQRLMIVVAGGLLVAGAVVVLELSVAFVALTSRELLETLITTLVLNVRLVTDPLSFAWFLILMILDGIVGSMMTISGALMLVGRERLGSDLGYLGLLTSVTTVNLLLFYFNQFAAVSTTIAQFVLLMVLLRYRRVYLGVGSGINLLAREVSGVGQAAERTEE